MDEDPTPEVNAYNEVVGCFFLEEKNKLDDATFVGRGNWGHEIALFLGLYQS